MKSHTNAVTKKRMQILSSSTRKYLKTNLRSRIGANRRAPSHAQTPLDHTMMAASAPVSFRLSASTGASFRRAAGKQARLPAVRAPRAPGAKKTSNKYPDEEAVFADKMHAWAEAAGLEVQAVAV